MNKEPIYTPLQKLNDFFCKKFEKEIETAYWEGGQDVPLNEIRCEEYYNKTFTK